MEFLQAFPVAIIDEDLKENTPPDAGCANSRPASEGQGFRVVSGIGYEDARPLAGIQHRVVLAGVGGRREGKDDAVEETRGRARREARPEQPAADLPLRDDRTAEMVPASVLRHANAFMRLFEDSPEFLARTIARSAQNYLDRLAPPMFKALMDYTLHASYSWHTPGHGGGVGISQEPGRPAVLHFFGENTLRSDISVSVGALGSLLDHTGPSPQANAMRPEYSAPTKHCLWWRHVHSQQDRLARHGGPRRPGALRPQLPQVHPALVDHDRRDADLPGAVAQWPWHHRADLA